MISSSLQMLLQIINFLILARVIISWLPIDRGNPIIQFLYQITEPILEPVRTLLEKSSIGGNMMMDFSPFIVLILIDFLIIPLVRNIPF